MPKQRPATRKRVYRVTFQLHFGLTRNDLISAVGFIIRHDGMDYIREPTWQQDVPRPEVDDMREQARRIVRRHWGDVLPPETL